MIRTIALIQVMTLVQHKQQAITQTIDPLITQFPDACMNHWAPLS